MISPTFAQAVADNFICFVGFGIREIQTVGVESCWDFLLHNDCKFERLRRADFDLRIGMGELCAEAVTMYVGSRHSTFVSISGHTVVHIIGFLQRMCSPLQSDTAQL
jgi:hypothetical protein